MKKVYALFFLLFLVFNLQFSLGQGGTWTWVNGDSTSNSTGVFGIEGVPSLNNYPPSLSQPAQWTDLQGNFWLFGGNNTNGYQGALWKYDPSLNEWTWVQGDSTYDGNGNYGILGLPSLTNEPPSRGVGILTWVDLNGDLWLFGGYHSGIYNDLWRYHIASNEWTWMKGSNSFCDAGSYGIKGVADSTNNPPPRYQDMASWTDNNGNFWLFGGYDNCVDKSLNDLWEYNPVTNNWTWMGGSNIPEQQGVYGTLGVPDSSNVPGARMAFSRWKDADGNLWIFGGEDYDFTVSYNYFNDLWKYDIASGYWTWESGSKLPNEGGTYGNYCTRSASNIPHCRFENGAASMSSCGNFLTFGGSSDNYIDSAFNDLWMYNPATGNWAWLSGDSTYNGASSYGTVNVTSPSNLPPARGGSIAWTGNDGSFYIFGGFRTGFGNLCDLWKFTIDSACSDCSNIEAPPAAAIQSSDSSICANSCVNFIDLSTNSPTSWTWTFHGATDSTSTAKNPQSICYQAAGNYNVTLIASNSAGSDTVTFNNYITVNPAPPVPVIIQHQDTLFCSTNPLYTSYQWYIDSAIINGATDTSLIISQPGNYNVQVSNSSGCSVAVGINIVLGLENYATINSITLSPNPVEKEFTVYGLPFTVSHVEILNVLGQVCSQAKIINRKSEIEVDVSLLASGIYFVRIENENSTWVNKIVKQ